MATHDVVNQSTPLVDIDLFATDRALRDALAFNGGVADSDGLAALGQRLGSAESQELARLANRFPPQLAAFDRFGHRIDEVEFHPAWHSLMSLLIGSGVHADPWARPGPGAQLVRAAKYLLFAQVENGVQCPVTMTYASVPVMQRFGLGVAAVREEWLPRLLAHDYDPRPLPAPAKRGLLLGMGMTEKQGGSDVRSNSTLAVYRGRSEYGAEYRITGHKWFYSAPQCDAHLVLAQTDRHSAAGISCFFVPRFLPDGSRNPVLVQRLKDKLGNRSNASSEVELDGATGWLVGEEGRGIPTILEMGSHTRLDCAIGSAGMMRALVAQALHHASGRHAFGRALIEQPLMRNVLADLALESEAATALAMRLAATYDGRASDPLQDALCRLLTPVAKYWICKRGPSLGAEAMEVAGGNGYVEDAPLARFYRELPVNSIWEGSGNVICLDVLRALVKVPGSRDALHAELATALGTNARYDQFASRVEAAVADPEPSESEARRLAEDLALAIQASLLLRGAPPAIADAFCASRLADRGWGHAFGTLPSGSDVSAILQRAMPRS